VGSAQLPARPWGSRAEPTQQRREASVEVSEVHSLLRGPHFSPSISSRAGTGRGGRRRVRDAPRRTRSGWAARRGAPRAVDQAAADRKSTASARKAPNSSAKSRSVRESRHLRALSKSSRRGRAGPGVGGSSPGTGDPTRGLRCPGGRWARGRDRPGEVARPVAGQAQRVCGRRPGPARLGR